MSREPFTIRRSIHTKARVEHLVASGEYANRAEVWRAAMDAFLAGAAEPAAHNGDEESPVVWVSTRQAGSLDTVRYHTDPECYHLDNATRTHEKPLGSLPEWAEECSSCAGAPISRDHGNPRARAAAVADTNPEDIGLDPLGERARGSGGEQP